MDETILVQVDFDPNQFLQQEIMDAINQKMAEISAGSNKPAPRVSLVTKSDAGA